jgi:hypothetical protein
VREELSITLDRLRDRTDSTRAILEPSPIDQLAARAIGLAHLATAMHLATAASRIVLAEAGAPEAQP